jgi:hypothetical protein
MKRAKQILVFIVLLAFAIPVVAYVAPEPQELHMGDIDADFGAILALCALMTWLNIGAAMLFVNGLGVFKQKLQRAYLWICAGLTLLGIALIQLPVLVALDLMESDWTENGGLTLPYVVAWFMVLTGLRLFARALGYHGWLARWSVLVPVLLAVGVLAGLVSRDWSSLEYSNWSFAVNLVTFLIASFCGLLAIRIKWSAGPAYTNALAWFILPLLSSALALLLTMVFDVFDVPADAAIIVPYVVAGALYVKAGYAFNKIREY